MAQNLARENLHHKMKEYYDRNACKPLFEIGQCVWVYTPKKQRRVYQRNCCIFGLVRILRFQPPDQTLLCNSRPPCWWTSIHPLPRTYVLALMWLFLNITPVSLVQRKRDILKRSLCVDLIHTCLKKSECSEDLGDYPSVEFPDIVNYFVLQTSWITGLLRFRAGKNNFYQTSGWNRQGGCTARVNHSQ